MFLTFFCVSKIWDSTFCAQPRVRIFTSQFFLLKLSTTLERLRKRKKKTAHKN